MRTLFGVLIIMMWFSSSCKRAEKKTLKTTEKIESVKTQGAEAHYTDLEGQPISLTDYKGKRILLNFWATWCRPCVDEMPSLERCKPFLEKENYVMLLASDQSAQEIKAFEAQTDFSFDFIRYTGALSQLKIYALPTTFVFNEQGEKVAEIKGSSDWDSPEMMLKLKNY